MARLLSPEITRYRLETRSVVSTTCFYAGVPCREYTRSQRGGYGRMWNGLKLEDTHIMSFRINKGPIPDGHHVLHHCDNPACWEPEHLWSGTVADNMRDRDEKGRNGSYKLIGRKMGPSHLRGVKHPRAKLTEAQVRAIRRLAKEDPYKLSREYRWKGKLNVSRVAEDYNVSESLVRGVIAGRNWNWVPSPSWERLGSP